DRIAGTSPGQGPCAMAPGVLGSGTRGRVDHVDVRGRTGSVADPVHRHGVPTDLRARAGRPVAAALAHQRQAPAGKHAGSPGSYRDAKPGTRPRLGRTRVVLLAGGSGFVTGFPTDRIDRKRRGRRKPTPVSIAGPQ